MQNPFNHLSKHAAPSSAFRQRLWQRLDAELETAQVSKRSWYQRFVMPVAALVIVVLLGGGGTYAYASPQVTPDSSLYSVKTGIEWMEERARVSTKGKAAFHDRMVERRNAELRHVGVREDVRRQLELRKQHHEQRRQELKDLLMSGAVTPKSPILEFKQRGLLPTRQSWNEHRPTLQDRIDARVGRQQQIISDMEAYLDGSGDRDALNRLYDLSGEEEAAQLLQEQRDRDIPAEVRQLMDTVRETILLPAQDGP